MNKIFETTGVNENKLTLYILCNSKKEVNKLSDYLWEDRRKGEIIEHDIEDNCCYYDYSKEELVKIPFRDLIKEKRLDLHKEYNKPVTIHHVYAE
ncbi:hypothetical protein [Clostridium rectalis]|uniref:hypothetical protein n=1 Tax=Clostridium rectalis TaxID=2040295 RepID=UPI000F62EB6D|nr:hypothetical protein [Clostridium rectalis]